MNDIDFYKAIYKESENKYTPLGEFFVQVLSAKLAKVLQKIYIEEYDKRKEEQ